MSTFKLRWDEFSSLVTGHFGVDKIKRGFIFSDCYHEKTNVISSYVAVSLVSIYQFSASFHVGAAPHGGVNNSSIAHATHG